MSPAFLLLFGVVSALKSCHEFFPLCAECSPDFSQCLLCKTGYYLLTLNCRDQSCDGLCIGPSSQCTAASSDCNPWEVWDEQNQACSSYHCPSGYFNSQGNCKPCHSSCGQCVGESSNECLSCIQPLHLSSPFAMGSCEVRPASDAQFDLFVHNYQYPPTGLLDGTLNSPFADLRDAFIKAAELSENYPQATINILLTKGVHYIPLEDESQRYGSVEWLIHSRLHFKGTLSPLSCDYTASSVGDICSEPGEKIEIRVKIGSYFTIPLADSFIVSDLIFDFSDSLVPWGSGCQSQRSQSCALTLMNDLPVVSSHNSECQCTSPLRSASSCDFNHPLSLFHSNGQQTPKQFTFSNSEIRNLFSTYSSIFATKPGLTLSLLDSSFNNISLCGSIINTDITAPEGKTIYSRVQKAFMPSRPNPSLESPLLVRNCEFSQIGLALHFNESPFSVFYQDGSIYSRQAAVFNIHSYLGQITVAESRFSMNKIYLSLPSQFSLVDGLPGYGIVTKKEGLMKSAMIYISNAKQGVTFLHNQFNHNSGLRGILRIEMPSSYEKGTLIFQNQFTHNSGYFGSSVLSLIASHEDQTDQSCSGFHVLHSSFSHNVALSNSLNLISLHCSSQLIPDSNKDDNPSIQEYLDTRIGIPHQPLSPDSNIHWYSINSSYSQVIDYKTTAFDHILVYENFKPQTGSLLSTLLIKDLSLSNMKFIRNGDFALASRYQSFENFCFQMGGLHSEASLAIDSPDPVIGDSALLLVGLDSIQLSNLEFTQSYASHSISQKFGTMLGFHRLLTYEIDAITVTGFYQPDMTFIDLLQNEHDMSPFPEDSLTLYSSSIPYLTSNESPHLLMASLKLEKLASSQDLIQSQNPLSLMSSEIYQCKTGSLVQSPTLTLNSSLIHHSSFSESAFLTTQLTIFDSRLLSLKGSVQQLYQGQSLDISNSLVSKVSSLSPQDASELFLVSSNSRVLLNNSTFSHNEASSLFTVFQGQVQIKNCTFVSNRGLTGSIALVIGNSYLTSVQSHYFNNSANTGGVFYLQDRATLIDTGSLFQENKSDNIAGILFYIGKSVFKFQHTRFLRNWAQSHGSVIHGVSEDKNIVQKITECKLIENEGLSTIYTFQTNLEMDDIEYKGNRDHQSQSTPLQFIGSQVRILNSLFSNQEYMDSLCDQDNGNKGGFVYDLSQNNLLIQNCKFLYGCAYQGGAMLMAGSSEVLIEDSDFQHNQSFEYGGAIYAMDFKTWKVRGSRFKQNSAYEEAADIYLQDSFNILYIQGSSFTGEDNTAVQSLWTRLSIKDSFFQDIEIQTEFQGVVECFNCAYYVLHNNTFQNIKAGQAAMAAGFLTYLGQDTHSLRVTNNTFINVEAEMIGGGLGVMDVAPNNMKIQHNYFERVRSVSNGGGLAIEQIEKPENIITVAYNTFIECEGQEGGAIYWSDRQPLIEHNHFQNNTAHIYGNDIASYGRRIGFVNEQFVLHQQEKTQVELNLFELTDQQSGGVLSPVYIAHFDKYGQVVKSINGGTIFAKVEEASLSNNNKNQWVNGTLKLDGLKLIGQPGSFYHISLTSPHINDQAPDVKAYLAQNPSSSSDVGMSIHLRKCKPGQAFLTSGECLLCEEGTYLLEEYSEPQECFQCPDQAQCFGGDKIGPKPGYWRSDRMSVNFFNCFNEQACLGSATDQSYDPKGNCHTGYTGVLCGQCEEGFTRNSRFECSKCPPFGANVTILVIFLLLLVVGVVLFIYFTLGSVNKEKSVFSIYVKAFVNHIQLLMLVSSFNLSWPSEVSSFLNTSKSVADAPQELFSIDCFIQSSNPPIKRFYVYLIMYALMPLIGLCAICIFWGLKYRTTPHRRSIRIISSSLVYFFLIHPSVTTVIMSSFYCIDIDGTYRLAEQLSEECWTGDHMAFSMSVGLLGLLIWTLGIPTCTMLLLYDERKNRALRSVKMKYGFLYKGYTPRSYMWEILVMYRKVFIAFISIFLASYGTMTQALVLLVVIMLFIFLTLRKRPFQTDHLNQLEVISLFAIIITVYCGLFFLSSRHPSSLGYENRRDFYLSTSGRWLLFFLILVSNLIFFVWWIWRLFSDLRDTLRSKCRRFYLCCCLLCNKNLLAMELKDSREEQKNHQKIKQIEEICDGKLSPQPTELAKYKRLYKSNEDFVDKQMFEELLHLISTRLNKIHRWKQKAFIKRSRRVTLATMPETARDELIQINPREFEGLPQRQTIELRAVDTELYDTEMEQHSTSDFQRSKLRKPTSISNASVSRKETFSRRATCLMQNFQDSLHTGGDQNSPDRKSATTPRAPSLIEYEFQSSHVISKRGGKSQFYPKNKVKRHYSTIRKAQPERIHEQLKDDIQASDILDNLESKEESFELTYTADAEKSSVRPQHTTQTESYTTGRVDSLEFSPECVRRARGMIRVEDQVT